MRGAGLIDVAFVHDWFLERKVPTGDLLRGGWHAAAGVNLASPPLGEMPWMRARRGPVRGAEEALRCGRGGRSDGERCGTICAGGGARVCARPCPYADWGGAGVLSEWGVGGDLGAGESRGRRAPYGWACSSSP